MRFCMNTEDLNNSEYVGDACNVAHAMRKDMEAQLSCSIAELTSLILQDGSDNHFRDWSAIQELIIMIQDFAADCLKVQLLHQILSSIPTSDKLSDWDEVLNKFIEE